MRLATARSGDHYRLYVEVGDGYSSLDAIADAYGRPEFRGINDAGDLLRLGWRRWEAVSELAEGASRQRAVQVSRLDELNLGPVVLRPSKIVCVGHNYSAHIAEGHQEVPIEPLLFAKTPNTLIGSGTPIRNSPLTTSLDYEGELALVIGKHASGVSPSEALDYVAGFTVFNDVSARDIQHGASQWFRGKSFDTFGPIGPILVTPDLVGPVESMRIETRVNGELRQSASCGDMIFGPSELIAFISNGITLEPGDVVATGTPAGVGLGFQPPRYLTNGDVVEVSISGLGTLRSEVAG